MLRGENVNTQKNIYMCVCVCVELMTPPSLPISESVSSNAVFAADFLNQSAATQFFPVRNSQGRSFRYRFLNRQRRSFRCRFLNRQRHSF